MKKIVMLLLLCIVTAVILSGCYFSVDFGIGNYLTGESYPDAENYETGAFTYDADEIQFLEIYWRSGKIEIIESDKDELIVSESSGEMDEDKSMMHYLLENGVLRIRFCASGAKINVVPSDKHLTIEVPKGIALSIHTTSAPVQAETLAQNSILISTYSGNMDLGSIDATDVNLSSNSGKISANHISAETLKCKASSGSVHIESLAADMVGAETGSGNVSLELISADNVEIHTSSGKTELQLPEYGAEVSYTAQNGKFHCNAAYERKGDLYVFGNGESKISVDSSGGNLNIEKAHYED